MEGYIKENHQYARRSGGHERAQEYRRTDGLSFCPVAHLITSPAAAATAVDDSTSTSSNNLEDV
eukprot:2566684-Ditylum_brightwellii.AAC.1